MVGSKGQDIFFLKVVMLHIKLKGMGHRTPCNYMLCPYTHPRSLEWVERSKYSFMKVVLLHIKIKWNGVYSTMQAHILSLHTHPNRWVGLKGKKQNLNVVMLHIKLKGKKYRPTKKQTP